MDPAGQTSSPPESPPSSPLSILSKSPSPPSSPLLFSSHDVSREYPSPLPSTPSGCSEPPTSTAPTTTTTAAAAAAAKTAEPKTTKTTKTTDENRAKPKPAAHDDADGAPPAKKRRIAGPKTRTTQYLDLTRRNASDEFQLERLLNALRRKRKIVVIAGAGISTSAGLDDFRSKQGLFASVGKEHKVKGSGKHLFDASVYRHDDDTKKFHDMVGKMATQCAAARPTSFHHMLASLAAEGRLMRLYTQNIDCIETRMKPLATNVPLNSKGPWPVTVQVHGSLDKMLCSKCGNIESLDVELFAGSHEAPPCRKCTEQDMVRTEFAGKRSHGIGRLRPRIVLYNEYNPDEEAIGAVSKADLRGRPDAVIVVGTTLQIPGVRRLVKELCQVTRDRRDGFTAWVNIDPEPRSVEFRDCWDLVVKGRCDDVAGLLALPQWDEPEIGADAILSEADEATRINRQRRHSLQVQLPFHPDKAELQETPAAAEKTKKKRKAGGEAPETRIEVLLDSHKPPAAAATAIPTPGASPLLASSKKLPGFKKPKQSKLSFGAGKAVASSPQAPASITKKGKPGKGKSQKKAAQSNTVLETFKSTKTAGAEAPKQKKSGGGEGTEKTRAPEKSSTPVGKRIAALANSEADDIPSSPPSPSLRSSAFDRWELPPLRPRPARLAQETFHKPSGKVETTVKSDVSFEHRTIIVKGDGSTIIVDTDGSSIIVKGADADLPLPSPSSEAEAEAEEGRGGTALPSSPPPYASHGVKQEQGLHQQQHRRRASTPERMHERRKSETISPRSVPRGMGNLLD